MYNPFAEISEPLINAMIKSPKLFVREHYARGITPGCEEGSQAFLFTHYEKTNVRMASLATIHMAQIQDDPCRFLYDSENPDHRSRLLKACQPSCQYKVFINLLYQKWEAPHWMRKKIHFFMLHNYPWWHYSKKNQLHIHLKDRYGQLYLHLSWKANTADLLLDELENFSACVMT